jgi:ABC-2 type transport system ATP-binding protein
MRKAGDRGGDELGAVVVKDLVRVYRHSDRRPGLRGGLRHLVRPQWTEKRAVDGVYLSIARGEAVGYVGPNGAGKSTTVKLLAGVIRPTSGTIRVNGMDPLRARRRNAKLIGVVWGQRDGLWWDLPLRDSLAAFRHIYDVDATVFRQRLRELVELFELGPALGTLGRQLSLGQRTRANLCAALLHNPAVLFLDEPTIGLDLEVKERVREGLRRMRRERELTILLTSHDLADVEALCDRLLLLLKAGRTIFDGDLREAIAQHAGDRLLQLQLRDAAALNAAALPPTASLTLLSQTQAEIRFDPRSARVDELLAAVAAVTQIADMSLAAPTVDDVIRRLSGPRQDRLHA